MKDAMLAEDLEELKRVLFATQQKVTFLQEEIERVRESVKRDIEDNWTMINSIQKQVTK